MVTKSGREAARLRSRQERGARRRHERPVDAADDAAGVDAAGNDSRHVPVHGARADRGARGRRADRHLCVRRAALRDADGTPGLRRQDACVAARRDPEGRPAARVVAGRPRHAGGARSRHQHMPREGSGRSLSVARAISTAIFSWAVSRERGEPRPRLTPGRSGRHVGRGWWRPSRWQDSRVASIVAIRHLRETAPDPSVGRVRHSGSRPARVCRGARRRDRNGDAARGVARWPACRVRDEKGWAVPDLAAIRSAASRPGRCLARTAPHFLFWSPDSRTIAFFADGKLKKMQIERLDADRRSVTPPGGRGGTWSPDGSTILFAPAGSAVLS